MSLSEADRYDVDAPDGVRVRFSMRTLERAPGADSVAMAMPVAAMVNPMTHRPTLAPLSILVDTACSTAIFAHRGERWPVTAELALDFNPEYMSGSLLAYDAATAIARAKLTGSTPSRALAECTVTIGDQVCAVATLAVAFIRADGVVSQRLDETLDGACVADLGSLMAVEPGVVTDATAAMAQRPDPMLLNATRHIHGGVSATGLELVSHAAISAGGGHYSTGSVRVNFLRPFIAGPGSRYEATAVRTGATMAIADATAVGDDGKVAALARVTAYR